MKPHAKERLPDNCLTLVREPVMTGKHLHQCQRRDTARDADFLCLWLLNLQAYNVQASSISAYNHYQLSLKMVITITILTTTRVDYPVCRTGQMEPV